MISNSARNKIRINIALNVVLPLAAGFFIYVFFKHGTLINHYLKYESDIYLSGNAGKFVICWLTDILWSYSLAFLLNVFSCTFNNRWPVILLNTAFIIVIELMQRIGIIHGTFDWLDIIFELIAMIVANIKYYYTERGMKK